MVEHLRIEKRFSEVAKVQKKTCALFQELGRQAILEQITVTGEWRIQMNEFDEWNMSEFESKVIANWQLMPLATKLSDEYTHHSEISWRNGYGGTLAFHFQIVGNLRSIFTANELMPRLTYLLHESKDGGNIIINHKDVVRRLKFESIEFNRRTAHWTELQRASFYLSVRDEIKVDLGT